MAVESGSHLFREIVHFLHLCGGTCSNLTLAQRQFRVQQNGPYLPRSSLRSRLSAARIDASLSL
jgi:hypothetical protein